MILGLLTVLRFWNHRKNMFLILFQSRVHMLLSMTIHSIHLMLWLSLGKVDDHWPYTLLYCEYCFNCSSWSIVRNKSINEYCIMSKCAILLKQSVCVIDHHIHGWLNLLCKLHYVNRRPRFKSKYSHQVRDLSWVELFSGQQSLRKYFWISCACSLSHTLLFPFAIYSTLLVSISVHFFLNKYFGFFSRAYIEKSLT